MKSSGPRYIQVSQNIKNYSIDFNTSTDGVYEISPDKYDNITLNLRLESSDNKLSSIIYNIKQMIGPQRCVIYCIFCIGNEREFGDIHYSSAAAGAPNFSNFKTKMNFGGGKKFRQKNIRGKIRKSKKSKKSKKRMTKNKKSKKNN